MILASFTLLAGAFNLAIYQFDGHSSVNLIVGCACLLIGGFTAWADA